jgi:hypothetical protein
MLVCALRCVTSRVKPGNTCGSLPLQNAQVHGYGAAPKHVLRFDDEACAAEKQRWEFRRRRAMSKIYALSPEKSTPHDVAAQAILTLRPNRS